MKPSKLKRFLLSGAAVVALATILACGPAASKNDTVGAVERSEGKAEIEVNGVRSPLKAGDPLPVGGVVHTGADGLVIAVLKDGRAEIEIQRNTELYLKELADKSNELHVRSGHLWARVNKLDPNEKFNIHTPTAIAGIRGTQLYTFVMKDAQGRDIHGTCHCEGAVQFDTHDAKYTGIHNADQVVLTREGKTVLLTAEELSFMGNGDHRHSTVEGSRLGPQQRELTPEQMRKFIEVVEKKFAEG